LQKTFKWSWGLQGLNTNAVEDIMTEAKGPRAGLLTQYEFAMPKAGSTSTRAENVFVDEELFTVLAAFVYLHLV